MVVFFFKSDGGIFIFQNFDPSQHESQEGKCCFSECQNNITKQKIDDIFAEQVTVTYRHFRYKRSATSRSGIYTFSYQGDDIFKLCR